MRGDSVREGHRHTRQGRSELATLLEFIREGDVMVVTRIDRLARSIGDLQDIVRALKAKDATLQATEQPIDTGTAAGKAFLDMLGVFAEFETNLRRERQMEGIAKAKAAGVYKGRKPSIDPNKVREMKGRYSAERHCQAAGDRSGERVSRAGRRQRVTAMDKAEEDALVQGRMAQLCGAPDLYERLTGTSGPGLANESCKRKVRVNPASNDSILARP